MTPGLRDFSFFLSSIFVYEPILIKISMNANIMKTQIFHKIKYDLKCHSRSQEVFSVFNNKLFLRLCSAIEGVTLFIIIREIIPDLWNKRKRYGSNFLK